MESNSNILKSVSTNDLLGQSALMKENSNLNISKSKRVEKHIPPVDIIEPKVYVPYIAKRGEVPRKVEIERKKRLYASFDLTQALKSNGVIDYLVKTKTTPNSNSIDSYSLSLFDNLDYEPYSLEFWATKANTPGNSGIPARAMHIVVGKGDTESFEWKSCKITKGNSKYDEFHVTFDSTEGEDIQILNRIYICFNAEDPVHYSKRLLDAVNRKKLTNSSLTLSLYADCMPIDNIRPLDSDQVNRILNQTVTVSKTEGGTLDTSASIQEYNLNHSRTMNQLSFANVMKNHSKVLVGMQGSTLDVGLFPNPATVFSPYREIKTGSEIPFEEYCKEFKFKSICTKPEAVRIVLQMQSDIVNIEKVRYSIKPEKTLRVEEFVGANTSASQIMAQNVKDSWTNAIVTSIRHNLREVKKGWLNIDESNFEVYSFSRLKRFLVRINIMMEDTIRNIMLRCGDHYVNTISSFCPSKVSIVSNAKVELEAASFPLFIVDLKFISPTLQQSQASFVYSSSKKTLMDAIIAPFDQSFDLLKGIVQVERRIMKKLFWANEPVVRIPHAGEDWALALREKLVDQTSQALSYMDEYLEQLNGFVDLISLNVKAYADDAEAKYCSVDGLNLAGLCELAVNHMSEAESVFHTLPSSVNLGMVLVDCKIVKNLLSAKHKTIAAKLFEILERKTREYADLVSQEFREIFDKLSVNPTSVEVLTEMKDYLASMPGKIDSLSENITICMSYFNLMDDAKYQVSSENLDLKWEVYKWPLKMSNEMTRQEKNFRALEHQLRRSQEEEQQEFNQDLANLQGDINKLKDFNVLANSAKYAVTVRRIHRDLNIASEKARVFNSREMLFGLPPTEYGQISQFEKSFEPFYDLWDSTDQWINMKEQWNNGTFTNLEPDAVETSVANFLKNLSKSAKSFERLRLPLCNKIAVTIRDEVDAFKPRVPIIIALRNPGMRDRHWQELSACTNKEFPKDKSFLTLQHLVDLGLVAHMSDVEKVAEKAAKEYAIESALNKMAKAWENVMLVIEAYRETGTYILKGIDDYLNLLDEHITMTQAMAFSIFKGPFEDKIDRWNSSLQVISEVIDEWTQLQRNWLYLQPIFDAPDINKQLPQEGKRFATVDKYWRNTMAAASRGVYALRFCDDMRLCERLKEGNKLLEAVQKGLADYLETKRAGFSRFYFLSNDELLEILSESKDPLRVQPHLKKCFEGIKSVNFQEDLTITGMASPEGEVVQFVKPVDPKNKNLEVWMGEVLDGMTSSVRDNMLRSIIEYTLCPRTEWMQQWPSQCVLNGSQVHWTREVEEALKLSGNQGCWDYYNQLMAQLEDMVLLIRGKITKLARVTIGSLAVIDVHARDVLSRMAEAGVSKVTDFDWISQMRYYWSGSLENNTGDLNVIMVSSKRTYGYEYLGNTARLVITPLTDKCYLTLMGALQMILGGAPSGPAGTGKTESTKDLAKALAKQCVVFNCSDGLDYMAMGKFFKGLASSGAWACFDEFNRINIEVLSVIAQQVTQLQGSVQRGEKRTIFEGTDIVVNPEFAVFITMNPGYAGRAELPDNLEALFRPVAMMVPDYCLIAEIMLFSYGYMENRKCAQKMVATFRLCSEQLSSQDHYDYGMRAVKTVITAAGNLKRASPDDDEEALLMRALQDVNVPKFLAHDLPLFYGILSDLFPGTERPAFNYGPLISAIEDSILEKNLQPAPIFIRKIIELYEMICVRHGLMVVGPTGGGKSSNIRVLGSALTKLNVRGIQGERYEKVKIFHMNPKSIRMGQLYGEFDENTHEWRDGILCVIIRTCIKEENSTLKWILFDGPVDALWIENMNTVLDDNKKLCLTSGEIIQLSEPMTMMFEPEDLAVASPATVSRCGMIYMEPTSLGYDVLLQSWLSLIPPRLGSQAAAIITKLFDDYVPSILTLLRKSLTEPLPTVNNCLVEGLLNLLDTFLSEYRDRDDGRDKKSPEQIQEFLGKIESVFIFSVIWSLCCTVNAQSRKFLDAFLRAEIHSKGYKLQIPSDGLVFDYKYDVGLNAWINWKSTISPFEYNPKLSFAELIIPTTDSIGYTFLLDVFVKNRKHVLMTGPTGTGKTVNIVGHLQNGLPDKYIPITLCFSAQTDANQTQDLIDSKCEKRRKGVFGPTAGKEFIIFVDDVNMPMKEEYGAQPPIELLRQWFDSDGWYDRKTLEFRKIIDVQYIVACGPPGGGRNHVTSRFYRHFNIINYVDMSSESLNHIFGTILTNFLAPFETSVSEHASGIVKATVDLYNTILDELRPTPTKPHYTFNMRDLSKVFQGVLMCDRRKVVNEVDLARLWIHETTCVFGDRLINTQDKQWLRSTLEDKLKSNTTIQIPKLWAESSDVIYADFMIAGVDARVYEEVTFSDLQPAVEDYLSEFNSESKQPMDLVMFKDALFHIVRISRVLRQPSGHALLLGVGGSGRQSLTKLATYISTFKLFQIEISKGYGMNEWRENLKQCLFIAGIQNKPIVFLFNDTQIINETMLEDINGVLNSGDVPNLYGLEDLESIATACKADCLKKKLAPTKLNLFSQYLLRVKANIHVVLCMSPLGDAFRDRLRKFPSIVNCSTIDYFMEWPDQALQSVAAKYLAQAQLNLSAELEAKLVAYFQFLHQSIERSSEDFYRSMKRRYYVTPTSYIELLSTYIKVLQDKRREVGSLRDRLQGGVTKLISTEKAVNELQASLKEMEPRLIKTQLEVDVMIVQITKDKAEAAETKAIVEIQESNAQTKASETKRIADDAQRDLDEALPALAEAVQCLKDLKKSDIEEVKSFSRPSQNVIRTLETCCIMFKVPPELVNDPDNPTTKIKDYFKAAQKNLLSNASKLLEDMTNYDKDNIPHNIISQIKEFYDDPTFTPEIIEKASKACKAMCMWVRAMYRYHEVSLMVKPKKALLAEAQASLDITLGELEIAQSKLRDAESHIANLEASFNAANSQKEQLVFDVDQCRARLERAVKLMNGLGGERTRWIESCQTLNVSYDNLLGDVLISSGTISYLGAFTPDYRQRIVKSWTQKLIDIDIPHTHNCNIRSTLSDYVAIRQWQICGLPQDSHSIENGIIMSKGRRYPLFIDPQGQANRFIKAMGKDSSLCPNDIDVIKLTDKNFLRTLENGVRFGRWILLENVGETIDAVLEPLLLQQKFKQGGTEMIKIGDSVIPWNDNFRFFMTTKLANPSYPPEVCVKVSLINFAITMTGLEDQLLGAVVVEEMPDMEEKKNSLVISNTRMRKELQELEDKILSMLSNSTGNILDDEKLIETLGTSKIKSQEIKAKVQEAEATEQLIDESRNMYRPVAYRGAILYFCVCDLSTVDTMYQYSLQWFRQLFVHSIHSAEQSEDIEKRIYFLNEYFTYHIFVNICRSLFERHKLIFAFLLAVRILQGENEIINFDEWMFLISGKTAPPKSAVGSPVLVSPKSQAGAFSSKSMSPKVLAAEAHETVINNPAPDWIDGRMWSEIVSISNLKSFKSFCFDVIASPASWRVVYDSFDPHTALLPQGSTIGGVDSLKPGSAVNYHTDYDAFQKLCILRTIRPDKIPDGVLNYVIEVLGKKFVEPPPFDLMTCYKDSNVKTPLTFVLSKGSDPTKQFVEFASKMKMDRKIRMLSLGQGQGPKAIKMIEEATQKGYWVLLQNCHLYISWLSELEKIVEAFQPENIHKDFRLWLTSMPCKEFPVSILQSSVKMTNEPPRGLRANLKSTYFKLSNDSLNVTKKPAEYKKLLFGLSFFHAIVQERRVFGPLGWNIPYEFNDTDFDISRGQLELFLDQYEETPWRVLTFLTSYVNYGGRVTDYIDLRTIDVIMKSFYKPDILSANYDFDSTKSGIYKAIEYDEKDPHGSYLKYIEALPLVASPTIFGMHENAKIASANAETFSMFSICLSLQTSSSGGAGSSDSAQSSNDAKPQTREQILEATSKQIYSKVQAVGAFDIEAISLMYPVVYEESMNTVLLQECIRYNKLIDVMETTLPALIKALNGLIVMSTELEGIVNSIEINQVPKSWASVAYPSMKPLSAWIDDLIDRLTFINSWIEHGVPPVFWISGFYFPQAFLTGTLQNFARKYKYPIDVVSFDFILLDKEWGSIDARPEDGVYIRGLYLEGARWDSTNKTLSDSLPKQLYADLPVIHLLPRRDRPDPEAGVYRCPVYKILSRRGTLSTTGHSTNFIMWIEIPSNRTNIINNEGKADQEEWIRGGIAAFTSLMY